jgi:hypothetical protein
MFSAASKTGSQAAAFNYVEDVFSTYLYTGTGAAQTITNGIDLAGKGGMVWCKLRSTAGNNNIHDTVRGYPYTLFSESTSAQTTSDATKDLTSFNSDGFSIGPNNYCGINTSGEKLVSWSFRKQPKFFDIVTWDGQSGNPNRTLSHNLASTPGCIIIKETSGTSDWWVWHRYLGTAYPTQSGAIYLNSSDGYVTRNTLYPNNSTGCDSTTFSIVGSNINVSGKSYIAYLFAHDAGGFGTTGTDNVITCGSFSSNSSGGISPVNLGYEPQWLLVKNVSPDGWRIQDVMRGWSQTQLVDLSPNDTGGDRTLNNNPSYLSPTATGFSTPTPGIFTASNTFIYVAIRRPMKVPTLGTSVFSTVQDTSGNPEFVTTFPVDMEFHTNAVYGGNFKITPRLTALRYLQTNTTGAEAAGTGIKFDYQNGFGQSLANDPNYYAWNFSRRPGFFDVVCYTGTGNTSTTQNHNLTVVPELIIIKNRTSAVWDWSVYCSNPSTGLSAMQISYLNKTNAAAGGYLTTTDIATNSLLKVGYLSTFDDANTSNQNYVSYLFATLAGVSKVGYYTGTGATQTINCGFTGGARFVLIKRTDSTGDWVFWDTVRGMVSGTDPRLALNLNTGPTNANWVYTATTGFQIVTSDANVNASGGSYIFLAIA